MSLAADRQLQALSKVLFGQAHRLAVMLAVARSDGLVNPGDLARELGFQAQSSIQDPLRDLLRAGLISRAPRTGPKTFYRRNPSSAWEWVEEVAATAEALSLAESDLAGHPRPDLTPDTTVPDSGQVTRRM